MARGKWDQYGRGLRAEMRRRLTAAGAVVVNAVRLRLSEPYPPESAPGESPHMRTGELRRSYTQRPADTPGEMKEIVGTNKVYAPRLEFGDEVEDGAVGGRGIEARPHLRPAFEESRAQVRRILSAPLPKDLV